MSGIRSLIIRTIQGFTGSIQLKGVPKMIVLTKNSLFKKGQVYKVYNKIRITINPLVNFHCLNVLNYGGYEAVKLFEQNLGKGDVFVDIGTNLGYMSLNAEKIVGKEGRVISLEPDPDILPILKNNMQLNNSSITLVEKAASDRKGTATFNIATESGLSRLENEGHNLHGLQLRETKEIEVDTLDSILASLIPNRPVKMMKIDVEGHELRVLKGASGTLEKYTPTIMMEVNHGALKQNNVTYKDLLDYLSNFSYRFYILNSHSADWLRFSRKPTLHLLQDFDDKMLESKDFDLVCTK